MDMKGWAMGAGLVCVSHIVISSLGVKVFFLKWWVEWRLRLGPKSSPISGQSGLSCKSPWWRGSQTMTQHGLSLLFRKAGKDPQSYPCGFTVWPSRDPAPSQVLWGRWRRQSPLKELPALEARSATQRTVPKPASFLGLPWWSATNSVA